MNKILKNKDTIAKILVYIASIITGLMIFAFIFPCTELRGTNKTTRGAKMISWMLGTNATIKTAGMSLLLVFEILLAIACAILIIVCYVKPFKKKTLTIYVISICALLVVCIILSFCSRNIICDVSYNAVKDKLKPDELAEFINKMNHTHLSIGPILYSVLGIVSLLMFSASILLNNIKVKQLDNSNINPIVK